MIQHDALQNQILSRLPTEEFTRLIPYLEPSQMPLGRVLYECSAKIRHIYFPTTSVIAIQHLGDDRTVTELSAIGREGVIGVSLFLGGEGLPGRAVVQAEGAAYRVNGQRLMDEIYRAGPLPCFLVQCAQMLLSQIFGQLGDVPHGTHERESVHREIA